jgi:hypothetical protein
MQKATLLLLSCLTAHLSHSQTVIKAGTVALGGSINYAQTEEVRPGAAYYGSTSITSTNKLFNFTPSLSYFVTNQLSIGVEANWSIQELTDKSSNSSASYRTNTGLRIGPFVRYYYMLSNQFGFTSTLGAGYERDTRTTASDANGFYAGLTPGLIFLPIPHLGLGASIGGLNYSRLSLKPHGSTTNNEDDIVSSFGASFGLAQLTFSGTYFFSR